MAEHYGFTEEEFDFIINYNIKYDTKYRMGVRDDMWNDPILSQSQTRRQHYVPRFYLKPFVRPDGKLRVSDLQENREYVSQSQASDHYHLYFRTQEGGERVIQTRYRSTASAMRKAKQVGSQLHFNRVLRDDFTVHIEPCSDSWSECRLWSQREL